MTDSDVSFGDRNSLCGIIYTAHQFADTEYQRRVWIQGRGPEVSNYSDALCDLFDSFGAERFQDGLALAYGFTPEIEAALRHFLRTPNDFDQSSPKGIVDSEIVQHPGWQAVVSSAAAFLDVSVPWLRANCGDYPMARWSWAGAAFGSP